MMKINLFIKFILLSIFTISLFGCGGSVQNAAVPSIIEDGGGLEMEEIPPPGLSIRYGFNGGSSYKPGSLQVITWSINVEGTSKDPGLYLSEVQYSANGTSGWQTVPGCEKVPGLSRRNLVGSDITCLWRMTNDGTPSGTNLAEGNSYKIRVKVTNASGETSNCDTATDSNTEDFCDTSDSAFIVDGTGPTITASSLKINNDGNTTAFTTSSFNVSTELAAADSLSQITKICIKTDKNEPPDDHTCWRLASLNNNKIQSSQGLGFIPGNIFLYFWVMDSAGNISTLSNSQNGTAGRDLREIAFSPSQSLQFLSLLASKSTDISKVVPVKSDINTSTANTPIYIRWKFKASASTVFGATPVKLYSSVDDGAFQLINSYAVNASSGCTAETTTGSTYAGCVSWSYPGGTSYDSKKLRFKIEITDSADVSYAGVTNSLNTGNFRQLTGYTFNDFNDHASNATFTVTGGGYLDSTTPNSLVVTKTGDFLINDTANGLVYISKVDGKARLIVPLIGLSCDTIANTTSNDSYINPDSPPPTTNDGCASGASATAPGAQKIISIALDYETPQNLYILEPFRIRKLIPVADTSVKSGYKYRLITVVANKSSTNTINTTSSPAVVSLGMWHAGGGSTVSSSQLFTTIPNGDLYFSMHANDIYAGYYQFFVYRPTMDASTNIGSTRLKIPVTATGLYACDQNPTGSCGQNSFQLFKPIRSSDCETYYNAKATTTTADDVPYPGNCLLAYGKAAVTFDENTKRPDALHMRWREGNSLGIFYSSSHHPLTGSSLLTAAGGYAYKFQHRYGNHQLYTSRKGDLYMLSAYSTTTGLYRYNFDASVSENPWIRILGNGYTGNCPDNTLATECSIDPTDVFIDETDNIFFMSRGQVRTVDQDGKVVTLFGKSKSAGDNGQPLMATYGTLDFVGTWKDSGNTERIVSLDSSEFAIRESNNTNVITLAGQPARTSNLKPPARGNFDSTTLMSSLYSTSFDINTRYWGGNSGMVVSKGTAAGSGSGNIYFSNSGGLFLVDRSTSTDTTNFAPPYKLKIMLGLSGGTDLLGSTACFGENDGKKCNVIWGNNTQPVILGEIPKGQSTTAPAKLLINSFHSSTKTNCYFMQMDQDTGKTRKYFGNGALGTCFSPAGAYYDFPTTAVSSVYNNSDFTAPYSASKTGNAVFVPKTATESYTFTFSPGTKTIARFLNQTSDYSPTQATSYMPYILPAGNELQSIQITTDGSTRRLTYCTTSGSLRYVNLSADNTVDTTNPTTLTLPVNIKCAGRNLDVSADGKRVIFSYTENGLYGIAEYQVYP